MPRHNRARQGPYSSVRVPIDHPAETAEVPLLRRDSEDRQDLENLRAALGIVAPSLYARVADDGPYLQLNNGEQFENVVASAGEFEGDLRVYRWERTGQVLGRVDMVDDAARAAAAMMGITPRGM